MRWALALAFGVTISVAAVPAGATSDAPTIHFLAGTERFAIMRAIDGAARRLAVPECQRVLTDFTDPEGRTLAENLARRGKTPIEFFNSLYLWEDRETPICLRRGTLAFTAPGQVVIRICSRRFKEVSMDQPRYGDAILIHEMLHALGLGENPPRSRDITRQVLARCR
jgi:hypothetical protein